MTGVERLVAQAVEQGFPEKITDPAALAGIAAILRPTRTTAPKGGRLTAHDGGSEVRRGRS